MPGKAPKCREDSGDSGGNGRGGEGWGVRAARRMQGRDLGPSHPLVGGDLTCWSWGRRAPGRRWLLWGARVMQGLRREPSGPAAE